MMMQGLSERVWWEVGGAAYSYTTPSLSQPSPALRGTVIITITKDGDGDDDGDGGDGDRREEYRGGCYRMMYFSEYEGNRFLRDYTQDILII